MIPTVPERNAITTLKNHLKSREGYARSLETDIKDHYGYIETKQAQLEEVREEIANHQAALHRLEAAEQFEDYQGLASELHPEAPRLVEDTE